MRRLVPAMIVVTIVLGLSATRALAGRGYLGASYVTTDSDFDTAVGEFETDASAWKGYGGFEIGKFLALEATYRDFGDQQETVGPNTLDVSVKGFDGNLRAMLPLGKVVRLFAKGGYAHISQDGTLDVGGLLSDIDEEDWEFFYGAGLDLTFGKHLGVRAEWEKFDVDPSLNSLSAGVVLRF